MPKSISTPSSRRSRQILPSRRKRRQNRRPKTNSKSKSSKRRSVRRRKRDRRLQLPRKKLTKRKKMSNLPIKQPRRQMMQRRVRMLPNLQKTISICKLKRRSKRRQSRS